MHDTPPPPPPPIDDTPRVPRSWAELRTTRAGYFIRRLPRTIALAVACFTIGEAHQASKQPAPVAACMPRPGTAWAASPLPVTVPETGSTDILNAPSYGPSGPSKPAKPVFPAPEKGKR